MCRKKPSLETKNLSPCNPRIVHFLYLLINLNLCWKELLVLAILGQIWRVIDNHRQVLATHLIHLCCYKVLICTLYLHHFHHPIIPATSLMLRVLPLTQIQITQQPTSCSQTSMTVTQPSCSYSLPSITQPKPDYRFPTARVTNCITCIIFKAVFCQVSNKADQDLPRLSIQISA